MPIRKKLPLRAEGAVHSKSTRAALSEMLDRAPTLVKTFGVALTFMGFIGSVGAFAVAIAHAENVWAVVTLVLCVIWTALGAKWLRLLD
jgi:hypothetical protein